MNNMPHQKLLIIDFGSQVTQLIARRLRELNVFCEIHPYQFISAHFITEFKPIAIILSGGPASVLNKAAPAPSFVALLPSNVSPLIVQPAIFPPVNKAVDPVISPVALT